MNEPLRGDSKATPHPISVHYVEPLWLAGGTWSVLLGSQPDKLYSFDFWIGNQPQRERGDVYFNQPPIL